MALCEQATSAGAVERINGMTADEALEVSTFLHDHLKFQRDSQAITPFPYTSDVLAVCHAFPDLAQAALHDRCADETTAAERGGARPSIFRSWTTDELASLPSALNRLYGVPDGDKP
jgi:hypothetical protein